MCWEMDGDGCGCMRWAKYARGLVLMCSSRDDSTNRSAARKGLKQKAIPLKQKPTSAAPMRNRMQSEEVCAGK